MARLPPVSRRELIERLKRLGFEGPYTGGRHQVILRGDPPADPAQAAPGRH